VNEVALLECIFEEIDKRIKSALTVPIEHAMVGE
jgi:hypothetical protein